MEAEINSRREIVEKYTKELENIDKKQLKRKEDIEANQLKFKEIENEIGISGGNKARELQEELDKARVAHALAGRNAESAQNELMSFHSYTQDQMYLIEGLWEYYEEEANEYFTQFCHVEVSLV